MKRSTAIAPNAVASHAAAARVESLNLHPLKSMLLSSLWLYYSFRCMRTPRIACSSPVLLECFEYTASVGTGRINTTCYTIRTHEYIVHDEGAAIVLHTCPQLCGVCYFRFRVSCSAVRYGGAIGGWTGASGL